MLKSLRRGVHKTPRQAARRSALTATFAVVIITAASILLDVQGALGAIIDRSASAAIVPLKPRVPAAKQPAGGHPDSTKGLHVLFVAQRADCNGNLLFANLASTRSIQRHTGQVELLIAGEARDTVGIRTELPYALQHSSIRLLSRGERLWLHAIGHHETPALLVYDQNLRLRIASHVDPDPVARVALSRAMHHLVTNDPSH